MGLLGSTASLFDDDSPPIADTASKPSLDENDAFKAIGESPSGVVSVGGGSSPARGETGAGGEAAGTGALLLSSTCSEEDSICSE